VKHILTTISRELNVQLQQVEATVALLDEGATVPFIARYRKEKTGALDDTQLRYLQERLDYLRELEARRQTILDSIAEQGKLTPELALAINDADTKTRLEDLYLPYKPKRRTKGQIAIEAGLEPLAEALFANPQLDPDTEAAGFIDADKGVGSVKAALEGAKYILMERFSEDAELSGNLRRYLRDNARLSAVVSPGKETEAAKFRDYFDHREALANVPSHRALAMFRGRREGFLNLKVDVEVDPDRRHPCELAIAERFGIESRGRPADPWLEEVVRWTWRIKLHSRLETDLLGSLREAAELEAIRVFAINLKDLLLSAPAGQRATIGLDPGLRTGVKVAVVDATGKLLDHTAIYPHAPQNQWDRAIDTLAKLAQKYGVELVAIGNGTASRETDSLVAELMKKHPALSLQKVMVNESGASIYSASEFAAREFPDLDVTIRGAVSIARRLQDPLAELVKIEPKSIGIGQYQHDVSQVQLAQNLDRVVEDCVNAVGVEVNTASAPLLRRVSGLTATTADNIVSFRDHNGAFRSRDQLKKVPGLGARTFELAAGFLRIRDSDNPLDASAVHPESYPVVKRMATAGNCELQQLIGNSRLLQALKPSQFTDDQFGELTVVDIIRELDKPGRDPRPEFRTASLTAGIETIKDLEPGMVLEGTVTNVTNFGAFVDIGVHQDGLVHISALANRYIKDPREVVRTGDIVKVKVVEVDIDRKRIALSCRLDDATATDAAGKGVAANVLSREKGKDHSGTKPGRRRQDDHRNRQNRAAGAATTPAKPAGSLGRLLQAAQDRQDKRR